MRRDHVRKVARTLSGDEDLDRFEIIGFAELVGNDLDALKNPAGGGAFKFFACEDGRRFHVDVRAESGIEFGITRGGFVFCNLKRKF